MTFYLISCENAIELFGKLLQWPPQYKRRKTDTRIKPIRLREAKKGMQEKVASWRASSCNIVPALIPSHASSVKS